jgi:uncharacterized protein DUF4397
MKICIRLSFAVALVCAALSMAAFASDTVSENGYLYIVQGIPGHDYSATTDPQFPVDVLLDGEICYEHGLTFGTIAGPLTLVPGTYDVKVSVANSLAPCTNSPFLDSSVTLLANQNVSAVVALSQTGTPTLLTFTNKFSPVTAGMGRVLFAQAADAPAVQIIFENTSTKNTFTYTLNPGTLLSVSLPAGTYTVVVNAGTTNLIPSTTVVLSSQSATLLYAVGEASNNTVTLETRTVKDVI